MEITQPVIAPPVAAPVASPTADPTAASAQTEAAASPYAQNKDRIDQFSSMLNDTSGKFTADEQLDAYNGLHEMIVRGEMKGMSHEGSVSVGKAMFETPMGKKVQETQANFMAKFESIRHRGSAESILDQVRAFDSFSSADQKIIFTTSLNAAMLGGSKPYTDVDNYRTVKAAAYKLSKYVEDNRPAEEDPAAAQNTQMQKALKLLQSGQQDTAWADQIALLFGTRQDIKDRVDLSPEARKVVGDVSPSSGAKTGYTQGLIANTLA
ncbi:hypothetical protein [Caulobacter sp.]|uniref:hypothetical protein n=1 Tax=Caulobacter sp. TaxID=78 RepID=UPI003BB02693